MILEEIGYSDKKNLVELVISGEKFFLSYEFFSNLNLSLDEEIDFDVFKKISLENDFNRCKIYAIKQISYSQKTSFDIRNKLLKKKFSNDSINRSISFLEEYGLIDDRAYVRAYVLDKNRISKWSKKKIFFSLKRKSIPDEMINENLEKISDEEEFENALYLAKKKAKDNSLEEKKKVYSYLASRGFSYDIINNCLGEIFSWHLDMFTF